MICPVILIAEKYSSTKRKYSGSFRICGRLRFTTRRVTVLRPSKNCAHHLGVKKVSA